MQLAMAKQQRAMAIQQQAASMQAQATQYKYPRFFLCVRRFIELSVSAAFGRHGASFVGWVRLTGGEASSRDDACGGFILL